MSGKDSEAFREISGVCRDVFWDKVIKQLMCVLRMQLFRNIARDHLLVICYTCRIADLHSLNYSNNYTYYIHIQLHIPSINEICRVDFQLLREA